MVDRLRGESAVTMGCHVRENGSRNWAHLDTTEADPRPCILILAGEGTV